VRLSVALATHDGQTWLPELLGSLATQVRLPDELVVCDDASSDGTRAVLDDFAATAPFDVRRVDHDARRGPVRAFETALAAVDGELVALCDQDDRWDRRKLAVLEAELSGSGVTLAFSDARMVDDEGADTGRLLWSELGFRRRQRDSLVSGAPGPLLRHAVASGCAMAVRRSVVGLALPFPATLDLVAAPMLHDRWLALVAGATGGVVPIPDTLVDYRVHARQAVGARWSGVREQLGPQARRRAADVAARAVARVRQLDALEGRLRHPTIAVQQQLDDLRHHLGVRSGLDGHLGRIVPVLGEVVNGGYRRFGAGPGSALLDLVRP
jgi:hypothetical protein